MTIADRSTRPLLTIAVPTFDRQENLRVCLSLLLPQLTDQCRLVVIDNCSTPPARDVLNDVLDETPSNLASVVRNRFNIGANANITRCFEVCDTDWLWIVGDDDAVSPTAVQTVLSEIRAHSDCVFFCFSVDSRIPIHTTFETSGLCELLDRVATTSYVLDSLGFISNTVYSTRATMPFLRFGNQFTYSSLPHIAMLLMALGDSGRCRFVSKAILDDIVLASGDQLFDHTELGLGRTILADLPIADAARMRLVQMFRTTSVTPKQLSLELLGRIRSGRKRSDMLYRYDQLLSRRQFGRTSLIRMLNVVLFRQIVRFPRLSYAVMSRLYYPLIKRRPMPSLQTSRQSEPFARL